MSQRLANYLLTYRKHAGLSQDEVAFLLGGVSGTKVSRYEQADRLPTLETALAFEAILGVPTRELFAGTFAKVETDTKVRADELARKIRTSTHHELQVTKQKLTTLERVVSSSRPLSARST